MCLAIAVFVCLCKLSRVCLLFRLFFCVYFLCVFVKLMNVSIVWVLDCNEFVFCFCFYCLLICFSWCVDESIVCICFKINYSLCVCVCVCVGTVSEKCNYKIVMYDCMICWCIECILVERELGCFDLI